MARNAVAFEVDPADFTGADRWVMPPGAYYFMTHFDTGQKIGIIHACPCGCGNRSAMWFAGTAHLHAGGPEWNVVGEWPKVTLAPSIGIGRQEAGGYHWHGFLEDGLFVER